jgi:hypothetical protein
VTLFLGDLINGMNEVSLPGFEFGVYPNPATANFTLTNSLPQKELPATFTIRNLNGQLIMEKRINSSNEQIDVSEFSAGVYICTLQSRSGAVSHQKLVLSN